MAYQSTNPYTGKIAKTFDDISAAQLEEKLQRADSCFQTDWRQRSFADRSVVLKRAAALMRERSNHWLNSSRWKWAN